MAQSLEEKKQQLRKQIQEGLGILARFDLSELQIKHEANQKELKPYEGEFLTPEGLFKGSMVRGIPNGKGAIDTADGVKITGAMFNSLWESDHKRVYPDGKVEEGRMYRGKWDGYHSLTLPDGMAYRGCKKEGVWHGPRLAEYPDGRIEFSWMERDMENGDCMSVTSDKTYMYYDIKKDGELDQSKRKTFKLSSIEVWANGDKLN